MELDRALVLLVAGFFLVSFIHVAKSEELVVDIRYSPKVLISLRFSSSG